MEDRRPSRRPTLVVVRPRRQALKSARNLFVSSEVSSTGVLSATLARARGEASRQLIENREVYNSAMQEVKREALFTSLMDDLTRFWKGLGDPEWKDSAKKVFLAHCGEIIRHRRIAACLHAEVGHVLSLRAEKAPEPAEEPEDAEDRQGQLQGFWGHYRSRGSAGAVEQDSTCWRAKTPSDLRSGQPLQQRMRTPGTESRAWTACSGSEMGTRSVLPSCETPATSSRASCRQRAPSSWGRRDTARSEHAVAATRASSRATMVRRRPFTEELELVASEGVAVFPTGRRSVGETRPRSVAGSISARWHHQQLLAEDLNCDEDEAAAGQPLTRLPPAQRGKAWMPSPEPSSARPGSVVMISSDCTIDSCRSPSALGSARTSASPHPSRAASTIPAAPPLNCWTPPMGGAPVGELDGPFMKYLTKCHEVGMAPLQVPFVTGHSKKLSVPNRSLEDRHIPPIAALAAELEVVEDIDLSRNRMLTDKSLAPLFRTFRGRPSAAAILRISLNGCRGVGQETIKTVVNLLRDNTAGIASLRELDMSSVTIPARCFLMLSSSVGLHGSLEDLKLADTGLGQSVDVQSCKIIGEILRCRNLASLDIGWSVFSTRVFAHLGVSLTSAKKLKQLSIPNCSSSAPTGTFRDLPIEHFLERLASLPSLTHLDVSLNRIDYRGALILEDALELHASLTHLDISDNYLGVLGLRSLIRLLGSDRSGLWTFRCDDSTASSETSAEHSEDGKQVFSVTCPGGRYSLDLSRPYHRSLLRLFYKTCERFRLSPQQAFTDVTFSSSGAYNHPQKDSRGQYVVQTQGRLAFTFRISWSGEIKAEGARLWDFGGFLRKQMVAFRLRPSFRKVVALFAHWRGLEGRVADQLAMLDAFASDFALTFPQLLELASCEDVTNEVLCRTLHCLSGGRPAQYLSQCLTPSPMVYMRNFLRLRNLLGFNADNPTGSYSLDLANPGDGMVAEQLLTLDRWEMEIDQSLKRTDVSQWGNRSHLRNMTHHGRPLHALMTEWIRPTFGVLEVDYSSGKRAPAKASALDTHTFASMLLTLHTSGVQHETMIYVLRIISHCVYLKSLQLRELVGCFKTNGQRVDIVVVFYHRVVDIQNDKIFRVQFFDDKTCVVKLRHRLGYASYFPFIQPENSFFRLDLGQNDQRMAASILVQLKEKEDLGNLQRYSLTDAAGRVDHLPTGVPQTWAQHEKVPRAGIFEAHYVCSPSARSFATRKAICERYGYVKVSAVEREVMWWSGLHEMPHDMQEFLEWLFLRFPNAKKAYERFCPSSGGALNLSRFRSVLIELRFRRFKGANEEQRLNNLFRYLNTSGTGEVSESEWMVLEQTFSDISVSLQEFVQFCQRAFRDGDDPASCLLQAWELLDEDDVDEVEQDSWEERVRLKLGYYNACMTIFHWLDSDRGGSISIEEFRTLERFLRDEGAKDRRQ